MQRDDERLLTRAEVAERYGLTVRFLQALADRGDGPAVIRLSPRLVRYRVRDIEAWISERADHSGNLARGAV